MALKDLLNPLILMTVRANLADFDDSSSELPSSGEADRGPWRRRPAYARWRLHFRTRREEMRPVV